MKKQEAAEFIEKVGQDYYTIESDGHYTVVEKTTGRRITKVENLPTPRITIGERVIPVPEFIDNVKVEVQQNGRLTIKKLAEQLGVDPEEIYTAVRKNNRIGKSGGHRGSRYYFTAEDVEKIREFLKK